MRVIIQRVQQADVKIDGNFSGKIGRGLLVLAGFEESDSIDDLQWICGKISALRIFDDENGKMNLSVRDINGELLIVSQFTLFAETKKGNRPSFIRAAKPNVAIPLYEKFIALMQANSNTNVQTGKFGADMKVSLINDGPVTIWIDSKNRE